MKKLLLLFFVIAFMFIAGCDSGVDTPSSASLSNTEENIVDLDSPTGGFTFSDEEPAFGEPEEYLYSSYEHEYKDKIDLDIRADSAITRRNAVRFRLRALWGRLACRYMDTIAICNCWPVDWSGSMTFHNGIIVIEKLIAFDQEDYVRRVDKSTIEWVSRTCPHFDGIQVRLIAPYVNVDSLKNEIARPALTIKTGPFTRTFTLAELDTLRLMVPVDRCCNAIILNSHYIPPKCLNGYLFGDWKRVGPDTLFCEENGDIRGILMGRFRGAWMNHNGRISGHLKGIYGVNSAGEHLFFGKYIGFSGRFKGILRGSYGPPPEISESAIAHGWFRGEWFGRNMLAQGRLKGRWASEGDGHGFFHGVWKQNCSYRSNLYPEVE